MQRDEYETELTGDRAELAAALEEVADGLRAGSLRLGTGEDALAVDLPEELTLEVAFETGAEERSLELELEWDAEAGAEDISAVDVQETGEEADDEAVTADESSTESSAGESSTEGDDAPEVVETAETLPVGAVDGPVSLGRFELYRDRGDEWRWRLRHRNGNVIASSGEGYTRKANAQKGLRSVMRNAPGAVVREE